MLQTLTNFVFKQEEPLVSSSLYPKEIFGSVSIFTFFEKKVHNLIKI